MIRLVEALNYRCLRHIRQPLDSFHVLVGPNASGKSSFLDILPFLSRLATDGLDAAIAERTGNVHDLFWQRSGNRFELAIEAIVPEEHWPPIDLITEGEGYAIRYEIAIGLDDKGAARILDEQILLTDRYAVAEQAPPRVVPETLFVQEDWHLGKALIHRFREEYNLSPEVPDERMKNDAKDYWLVERPTGKRPILQTLSEYEFPTATWLDGILKASITSVDLVSAALRQPSRPGQSGEFVKTGENLPWVISNIEQAAPGRYKEWITHLRQALPDLEGVRVIERPEDRHRYLMLRYNNGLEVPSWMLSDGTLRLLALTLIAYLPPEQQMVYLIEEPETSIHPLNIEVVMQSLSSVYDGQVLATTHSPTVLSVTKPEQVLVFSRTPDGGTQITKGSDHPGLRQWKGQPNLSVLYASGVLG